MRNIFDIIARFDVKDINSICIIGAGGHTRSLIALIRRATNMIFIVFMISQSSSKNERFLVFQL